MEAKGLHITYHMALLGQRKAEITFHDISRTEADKLVDSIRQDSVEWFGTAIKNVTMKQEQEPNVKMGEIIGNCRVLEVPLDPFKETFDAKEMLIAYNSEELQKVKEVVEHRAKEAFRHLVQRTKDENEEHYELYFENIYGHYVGAIKHKKIDTEHENTSTVKHHKKIDTEHENTSTAKPHKLIDEFRQMENCPYKDDWHYCCRCDKETFCKWADSPRKSKEAIKKHIQENWGK